MPSINVSQDLADYFSTHEELTGETAEELIRGLLRSKKPKTRLPRTQARNTALARFLQILSEIEKIHVGTFHQISSVKGDSRIYFSKSPEEIQHSGSGNKSAQIPDSEWWVTSNTSTDTKGKILLEVLKTLRCSQQDSKRWMEHFWGPEKVSVAMYLPEEESEDLLKI